MGLERGGQWHGIGQLEQGGGGYVKRGDDGQQGGDGRLEQGEGGYIERRGVDQLRRRLDGHFKRGGGLQLKRGSRPNHQRLAR